MSQNHTVKGFDDDLRQLRSLISQMGGLAEVQIQDAVAALVQRDVERAHEVIGNDARIDQLELDAEKLAITTIALRQPLADDLREVVAALKISSVIERIGDYAKNIAKRSTVLSSMARVEPMVIVPEMARLAVFMLSDVLDAYAARDAVRAMRVWQIDKELDDLYTSLFRSLLTNMVEQPGQITACTHLLFIAKNLERIGDHATNIAEIVQYIVTGAYPDDSRPKADETPFAVPGTDSAAS